MPVYLHHEEYDEWLDPTNENIDALSELLKPYPASEMAMYQVSKDINSVKNNFAELLNKNE